MRLSAFLSIISLAVVGVSGQDPFYRGVVGPAYVPPESYVPPGSYVPPESHLPIANPCGTAVRTHGHKYNQCLSRGYSCNQCTQFNDRHRSLKEINVRHLVDTNKECGNEYYDMFLAVKGAHFVGLATPQNKSHCPLIVFHTEVLEDSTLQKVALEVHKDDLVDLEENESKLHLGSQRLANIVDAFESAPVSKEGVLYDAISNNCVVMLRNMADPLDIPVDERMLAFITRKLTSAASAHIIDMMKESPALQMLYHGSRRFLKGVTTEDLVAGVIKLYA